MQSKNKFLSGNKDFEVAFIKNYQIDFKYA